MKKLIFIVLILLISCGGGGGGGGGGDSEPTEFTGTYDGTMLINATGPGGTVSTSVPMTVQILGDGRVTSIIPVATEATCSAPDNPMFLSGNTFSTSATGSCNIPNVGVCSFTATISGSVNGNVVSGSGRITYNCPTGITIADLSFTATKTSTVTSSLSISKSDFVDSVTLKGASIPEIQ